jgi:hypothetical protein
MPFWRAKLSAERFIAAVGGHTSPPLTDAKARIGDNPTGGPLTSLPITRWRHCRQPLGRCEDNGTYDRP